MFSLPRVCAFNTSFFYGLRLEVSARLFPVGFFVPFRGNAAGITPMDSFKVQLLNLC